MRPQNRFVKKTKKSTFAFEKVEMLKGEQKVSVKNLRGLEASQFNTLFLELIWIVWLVIRLVEKI